MDSGWIINFKDGTAVILSESKYKEYEKTVDIGTVYSEEHWFDIKDAVRKNPWLEVKE
jgi:hypothetical protein